MVDAWLTPRLSKLRTVLRTGTGRAAGRPGSGPGCDGDHFLDADDRAGHRTGDAVDLLDRGQHGGVQMEQVRVVDPHHEVVRAGDGLRVHHAVHPADVPGDVAGAPDLRLHQYVGVHSGLPFASGSFIWRMAPTGG